MAVSVALGPPDQIAVVEQLVIVAKIDPVIRHCSLLGEDRRRRAGCRIDLEHVEHGLLAVLALDVKRAAIGRPIHPCEIDRRIAFAQLVCGEIDLHAVAAIGVHHVEFDIGILAARDRIALVEHLGAGGADRRAGDNADHAFVEAFDRHPAVVGAPPIAGQPRHFLLRDELRLAPAHVLAFLRCNGPCFPAHFTDPEPAVAHEGDVGAGVAERGIELALFGIGQLHHVAAQPREVEVAVERDEHAAAIVGPLIVDDPLQAADPRALALHLLVFGQVAARSERLAVDQHRPFARVPVISPQIVALAVGSTDCAAR